jgi:hypothetical protein
MAQSLTDGQLRDLALDGDVDSVDALACRLANLRRTLPGLLAENHRMRTVLGEVAMLIRAGVLDQFKGEPWVERVLDLMENT